MKTLITLAIIAGVLLLISRVRLGAMVEYAETGLLARVRVGAVKLTLYPRRQKRSQAGQKPKKQTKTGPEGEPEPKKGGSLALVKKFLPLICEAAGRVREKIRIDTFYLDFTAAAPDPAAAALAFGGANAFIGMIWPMIEQNFKVKDRRIRTAVDYSRGKPAVYLYAAATMNISQALHLGTRLVFKFIKLVMEYRAEKKARTKPKQKEAV